MTWIRMLSLVLGSSLHAFELILSAFITGLALGRLAIRGRMDRLRNPLLAAGRIQIVMGLLAVATLPVCAQSFDRPHRLGGQGHERQLDDFVVYDIDGADIIVVAARSGPVPAIDEAVFAVPELKAQLARVGVKTVDDLRFRWLGSKADLGRLLASFAEPANSDFAPFVELHAPRAADPLEPARHASRAPGLAEGRRRSADTVPPMELRLLRAGG